MHCLSPKIILLKAEISSPPKIGSTTHFQEEITLIDNFQLNLATFHSFFGSKAILEQKKLMAYF